MFFMFLLYLTIGIIGFLAIYHWVIRPITEDKQNKLDEAEAERITKKAELVGNDLTTNLAERIQLLEELSAQLQTLRQTALVAERIAAVPLRHTAERDRECRTDG